MIRASLISIGNELLNGSSINSNAATLSEKLVEIGIEVNTCYTITDDIEAIKRAVILSAGESKVIIITGGLGPTDDDLTREALSDLAGVELALDEQAKKDIEEFFSARNKKMPQRNIKQAYVPSCAVAIRNEKGTAPGIKMTYNNSLIFALPGVPSEMLKMYDENVKPDLLTIPDRAVIAVERLKCFGLGESTIAQMLGDTMKRGRNPLVNCTCHAGIITLHIIATADTLEQARELSLREKANITAILGDVIYTDQEKSLSEVVGEKLSKSGKTIALAESCTGGLLGKMITDIPGSSEYLLSGWITYSNQAKIAELGIDPGLIEQYGAVSEQVAREMALGARKKSGAGYTIAITGIAGPGGGTADKDVGLVFIAMTFEDQCTCKQFNFHGSREMVRKRAANEALNMLRLNC